MKLIKARTAGLFALAVAYGMGAAHASPIFGVVSMVDISSGNGLPTFPSQVVSFSNGGNPVPVTSYTSPVLSNSGSYTFGSSTVSGSAMSWATVNDGSLHGYASASLTGLCETCPIATENGAVFDPVWYDTISVAGLPDGTPVDLLLTDVLHSSLSGSGTTVTAEAQLGSQQVTLQNILGNADGTLNQSIVVHTAAGATLQLVAQLNGSASVADLSSFQTGTADASNTASTFLTVLTPGASYTTASGVSYAAPSSVPEPASALLMISALAAVWVMGARLKRTGQQP